MRRVSGGVATAVAYAGHDIRLIAAETPAAIAAARLIFAEYAAGLGIDLSFQRFDAELATLPGEYAAPAGRLLLALRAGETLACGAVRPLHDAGYANACEMKRLYVRTAFRGLGLGRRLAEALLDGARQAGYSAMLLDTLDEMEAARSLYEALGFKEIPPYYYSPVAGAHYLMADLT